MEDLSGQTVQDYYLLERIGAGSFGPVYLARQITVEREVAIKFILPGFANNPDFIRRFQSEANIIARLEHPHITPLHDFWRDPNGAYLVMRFLRGGSVLQSLQKGPYGLNAVSQLMDQIASALDYAHRHDVIHRDIKPSNILLDEDGNAYLADFGIATGLVDIGNQQSSADAVAGSSDYISPEQARGEPVTPRTDIYSLGVTLYEIVTGEHPYQGASSLERLYKHINDPIPAIDNLQDGDQDAVNDIIQKATAKNPKHRFPNAPAMAAAFRTATKLNGDGQPDRLVESLTRREQEILHLIIQDSTNREIAQLLFLELSMVKWHITQQSGNRRPVFDACNGP